MDKLLRECPFCGGAATVEYKALAYEVGCDKCDAVMDVGYLTEAEAIADWNRRVPTAPQVAATPQPAMQQYLQGNTTITATRDEWNQRYIDGWTDGNNDANSQEDHGDADENDD